MYGGKVDSADAVSIAYEPFLLDEPATDWQFAPLTEKTGSRSSHAEYKARYPSWAPSLAGIVGSAIAFGLCLNGIAATIAPVRYVDAELLFWAAIIIPFVVFVSVLMVARPSPRLRSFTISAVGLYPSTVYRLSSPLVLGGFDEHLHEQELLNLLRGSGLFAPNPMLTVGPNYPGMELFTGVLVRLSGMPVILVISLAVLLCRLIFVLTIYNAALTISPSRRLASLTVVFYAVSPQFYFFNSQFAYQTMALTLGLGGLFLLRRAQLADDQTSKRRFSRAGTLALLATVVTHHVTSWIVLAFLISWAMITPPSRRKILVRAASIMGVAIFCWTAIVADRLVAYLKPIFNEDLEQFRAFTAGSSQRKVFGSAAGTAATPQWERGVLIAYSLICAVVAIVVAWILISRALRARDHMLGFLGVLCLASPITLAAHFVPSAASLGDRASTFFFLPLALSCSLVVMRDPRVVEYVARRRRQASAALTSLICVTSLAYMGGVMLGSGPNWQWLPGPYLVSADPRTQDAETMAAVSWAATHLPPGGRLVADRVPADLLESQARLWPVTVPEQGLQPASLFFSNAWTSYQTAIVREMHIEYLYVDQRLADSLPHVGYYFYPGETPKPRRISGEGLSKFAHVPGLRAVYHHGPVTIYDTAGLSVTSPAEGFVGERNMGLGAVGDVALGALVAGLILRLRRRLSWVESAFSDVGAVGATITFISVGICVASILFALYSMPGPNFSVGAVVTMLIVAAFERRLTGKRLSSLIEAFKGIDPLVVLSIIYSVIGILISIRAASNVDVKIVETILREVASARR